MSSLKTLKINFFSAESNFLEETFRLERLLSSFGSLKTISKGGGIAQFELNTRTSVEEVRVEIEGLSLDGKTTCEEHADEEMESA